MRRLRGHSEDTSMKAFAILPALAVAILALNISSASSQGNSCGKEYQACMDSCATKSSKNTQGSCFTSCEGRNNLCSESMYGKRPVNGIVTVAPKAQAKDALAKKEKTQEAPPQEQAADEPQQKEAPQAAPQQQRAPAKR
jgi:hypothetical protein